VNARNFGPQLQKERWPTKLGAEVPWRDRTRINARRIRAGWGDNLSRFAWEYFSTLTLDPKKTSQISEQFINKEVFAWCNDIARFSRSHIAWVYAVEGGGGGSLHAHALIVGARDEGLAAADQGWRARNGEILTRRVDDIDRAVAYVCKCIGPNGEVVFSDSLNSVDRWRRRSKVEV